MEICNKFPEKWECDGWWSSVNYRMGFMHDVSGVCFGKVLCVKVSLYNR